MNKRNRLFATAKIIGLLLVLGCGSFAAFGQNTGLYLFIIQTQANGPIENLRESQSWSLKLYVDNPDTLNQVLADNGIQVLSSTSDYTELVINDNSDQFLDVTAAATDATFVIDYNEPVVISLAEQLRTQLQRTPTIVELTQFVDSTISDKTYARGFDIASQVARHRSGDCTEHAVLLTALARYFQMPAKVTFGLLLYEENDILVTAGHAWTTIYYDRQWVRADATRSVGQPDNTIKYIPLQSITNESASFGASMYTYHTIFPSKVVDVQPFNG